MGNKKLSRTLSVIALGLGLGMPNPAQAPSAESILVGPVRLTEGMHETDVLRTMRGARYRLRGPVQQGQSGHVWAASPIGDPDFTATLSFFGGLLESVDVGRGPRDDSKGVGFAEAAYYAIADLAKGSKACTVETELNDTAPATARTASIRCGQKYVSIHITELRGRSPSAWVAEGLGQAP